MKGEPTGYMHKHRVLVLNASFEAINICTSRRAIKLLLAEKALMVETSDKRVSSERQFFELPEVIRLRNFVKLPHRPIPFSRKNIFLRDGYVCQYCAERFPVDQLTLDHIQPVSRGGADSWTNVVTACKSCNHHKGNHYPEEMGMMLLRRPSKPTLPTFLHLVRLIGEKREVWRKYLFYDEKEPCKAVV